MSDSPTEPLKKLRDAAAAKMAEIGLNMLTFVVQPGDGDGPDVAHTVFAIDPDVAGDTVNKSDEQRQIDAEFKRLIQDQKRSELEEQTEETARAAQELARRLEEGGGILPEE